MLEIKNKKFFAIVIFIITIAIIYFCYTSGVYNQRGSISRGLELFYEISGYGNFLPFFILISFLTNNVISDNYYKNKYSHFQNSIITRVGNKKRTLRECKNVLIYSFICRLLLSLFLLFIINNFFINIDFNITGDRSYYPFTLFSLSNNSFLSLFFYIIYSSIGFSIFSLFMYSLIDLIKNLYIYKISGILFSIFGVMLPALLGNLYLTNIGTSSVFSDGLLYLIYSGGLLTPGIEVLGNNALVSVNHLYFLVSLFGYLVITIFILLVTFKGRIKNG